MSHPVDRTRPRWWVAKLRLSDVREQLLALADDEDWSEAAHEALAEIADARPGLYDWLAIQRESGEAPSVVSALREVGSRILEGRRGAGRPGLSDASGPTAGLSVRLTDAHRAELDRLVGEGRGATRVEAIRLLIEQSAATG